MEDLPEIIRESKFATAQQSSLPVDNSIFDELIPYIEGTEWDAFNDTFKITMKLPPNLILDFEKVLTYMDCPDLRMYDSRKYWPQRRGLTGYIKDPGLALYIQQKLFS